MSKKIKTGLPILKAFIADDLESDLELSAVALVDRPAIEANFLTFSDELETLAFKADEDRHIITGPLMIADLPIYRKVKGKEFYVVYEADTVYKMVQKFFKKGYQAKVNLMHDPTQEVEGVTLFESFIKDPKRGVGALKGFEKVPAGTWFGSFYVDNSEVWEQVKDGTFKGFSIEGLFAIEGLEKVLKNSADDLGDLGDEDLINELREILSQPEAD